MNLRTPLSRVTGRGSAKTGAGHWWGQRLSALALVPLGLWFAASVVCLAGASHGRFVEWISAPWSALLMILFIAVTAHHAQLGVQVVIEDYVHREWLKVASILAMKFTVVLTAAAAVWAVLRMAL
ncbi:MAG: succinate dehydrogenase, hydrophobic membrane anchor protein [Gammaproteobacteria bacterium]|nr:succinate dehydrogenase, hydrophobic membrane anchor protein [Gammaproteobacteria bacterium]MDD9800233.1 succinate dehydrogenase, hydrophobic membrane anchor protein [Gammaproteobacteria bacterium]MDD9815195.1 succinate dehydrogenase, hydrophobic membrane anchor protein [Gammaproteobacteria bacterium]MDD9852185.1 succinate dehydrogenase, hydrophobic membrane anchor protein [Gammaproteobacteria bacterium]MDD9871820.1 succinate dehydrogenase, hydrophobic membrane anchor protein [Gammaproteobac